MYFNAHLVRKHFWVLCKKCYTSLLVTKYKFQWHSTNQIYCVCNLLVLLNDNYGYGLTAVVPRTKSIQLSIDPFLSCQ